MHRPAAAKARVKAAAKVRLRRPAAAPALGAEDLRTPEEKFNSGETVVLAELPIGVFKAGLLLAFEEGSYFGGACQFAGRFREVCQVGDQLRIKVLATGTTHEDLLKYVTGTTHRMLEVHLCGADCTQVPHNPGVLHARKGRRISVEKEVDCTWEKNIMEEVDQLAGLREAQREMEGVGIPADAAKKLDKKAKSLSSSSSGKKKKKKKKKRSREKERKKTAIEDVEKIADKEGETMKRRYGGRTIARKELGQLFGGTGLDPKPQVRRRVLKYARKKMAKKKDSTSSDSDESTSRSEAASSEEGNDVLMDSNRLKQMSRHAPGSLTAMGVARMQESLTEQEGVWQLQESNKALPAVTLRYVRSSL